MNEYLEVDDLVLCKVKLIKDKNEDENENEDDSRCTVKYQDFLFKVYDFEIRRRKEYDNKLEKDERLIEGKVVNVEDDKAEIMLTSRTDSISIWVSNCLPLQNEIIIIVNNDGISKRKCKMKVREYDVDYLSEWDSLPVKNHLPGEIKEKFRTKKQWLDAGFKLKEDVEGILMHPSAMSKKLCSYFFIDQVIPDEQRYLIKRCYICSHVDEDFYCPIADSHVGELAYCSRWTFG